LDELETADGLGLGARDAEGWDDSARFDSEDFRMLKRDARRQLARLLTFGINAKTLLHQLFNGFIARFAAADQADDFIDIAHREDQPFENVLALLCLAKLEACAAGDDIAAMIDEMLDQLFESHRSRLA